MRFDMMTMEVDGSLKNPIVVLAVLLWGVFLFLATAVMVRRWMKARTEGQHHARITASQILVVALYLGALPAEVILGNLLYKVDFAYRGHPETISVGFWGGPPVLPAWGIGLLGGFVAAVVGRWMRPGSTTSSGSAEQRVAADEVGANDGASQLI